jgi:hypothetical protein
MISQSATQEIFCLLWNPKIHCILHEDMALTPVLSQLNWILTLTTCLFLVPWEFASKILSRLLIPRYTLIYRPNLILIKLSKTFKLRSIGIHCLPWAPSLGLEQPELSQAFTCTIFEAVTQLPPHALCKLATFCLTSASVSVYVVVWLQHVTLMALLLLCAISSYRILLTEKKIEPSYWFCVSRILRFEDYMRW